LIGYRHLGKTFSKVTDKLGIVPLKIPISEGRFNSDLVRLTVNNTLESDYQKFINKSLSQIKTLEALGYKRQEIVAFCNMLPARVWPAFVRRLSKSKSQENKS